MARAPPSRLPQAAKGGWRVEGELHGRAFLIKLMAGDVRITTRERGRGARVLGCNHDTGERYLSVPDFLPA